MPVFTSTLCSALTRGLSRSTGIGIVLVGGLCAAAGHAAEPLVLHHARMLDLTDETGTALKDTTIVVADGKIVFAGPPGEAPAIAGAREIDATGLTALPGFADMHVHVWDEAELGAYLAHGITTVRNMSGMPFHLDLQQRIESGTLDGPRLLTSGPILNSQGANAQINHQLVETANDARAAVAAQASAGFTRIKVYSNLRREAYEAAVTEARKHSMAVAGHTPEGFRAEGVPFEKPFAIAFEEILDDRFETIEHVESILWHGLAENRDEALAKALAERIAESHTPVTPTLVAHHNLLRMARSQGAFAKRPGTETLNPLTQKTETAYIETWSKQDPALHEAKDAWLGHFTQMLDQAGVTLVTGSDSGIFSNIPGQSLIDEFALMTRGGMSPMRVLRASSTNAAKVLGEEERSGCMRAGCRADIVLLACDASEAIGCTRHVRGVVAKGRWYDRPALDALLAAAARPDMERTARNLMAGMAAQGTPLDPAALGL